MWMLQLSNATSGEMRHAKNQPYDHKQGGHRLFGIQK